MNEREAFETMMRDKYPMKSLTVKSSDYAFEYSHLETQCMFLGFQAALASQAQQTESKPVCKNCLNTGIEFGVYKNFQCSFCIPPAPKGDKP